MIGWAKCNTVQPHHKAIFINNGIYQPPVAALSYLLDLQLHSNDEVKECFHDVHFAMPNDRFRGTVGLVKPGQ
jgi:hypothetical protein